MYAKQTIGNQKNAKTGVNNVKNGMAMNDDAVSPVIGVILMVAITVIMATVIGSFVFGMAGGLDTPQIVGVTATQTSATDITFTFVGGPDADSVIALSATVGGNVNSCSLNATQSVVGATMTSSDGSTGSDHVIVIATFLDESSQVVLDTSV